MNFNAVESGTIDRVTRRLCEVRDVLFDLVDSDWARALLILGMTRLRDRRCTDVWVRAKYRGHSHATEGYKLEVDVSAFRVHRVDDLCTLSISTGKITV